MREYNKKIEEALTLVQNKKIGEAASHLSKLVDSDDDKTELAGFIEAVLTENAKEKPETRESLKTLMSSITWRISQGFGYR